MTSSIPPLRRAIGWLLRAPIVGFLTIFWVVYLWWWIFSLTLLVSAIFAIAQPVLFVPLYILAYLWAAFTNDSGSILPDYFSGWPRQYIDWCERVFKLGFPTLGRWLKDGFFS